MRRIAFMTVAPLAGALVLLGSTRPAGGHGAVIRLGTSAVAAGDSLDVSGEGVGSADSVALVLEGAGGTFPLAAVQGDVDGRFATRVRIPPEAPAGEYRIVATGGHDRASEALLVTAGAPALEVSPHTMTEATADDLALARRRTPLEVGIAGAVLVALIAAGLTLARPGRSG